MTTAITDRATGIPTGVTLRSEEQSAIPRRLNGLGWGHAKSFELLTANHPRDYDPRYRTTIIRFDIFSPSASVVYR
jgi:hypothetical protein